MCEPAHSIVQFSMYDDELSSSCYGDSNMFRLQMAIGPQLSRGQEVMGFFNFSEHGRGHGEAVKIFNHRGYAKLPEHTKYEVDWWNRSIKIDGEFGGKRGVGDERVAEAIESARQYAMGVSIGSVEMFTGWFKESLLKTSRVNSYIDRAKYMLNERGGDKWEQLVSPLLRAEKYSATSSGQLELSRNNLPVVVENFCSIVKDRSCVVPEWSDDDELWKEKVRYAPTY